MRLSAIQTKSLLNHLKKQPQSEYKTAFMIAAATGLPPLRPEEAMKSRELWRIKSLAGMTFTKIVNKAPSEGWEETEEEELPASDKPEPPKDLKSLLGRLG